MKYTASPSLKSPERRRPGRFLDLDADKLRGGYYTPPAVSEWIARWAIRSASDQVLEPSCGDGAFLRPVAARLAGFGASATDIRQQVLGIEAINNQAVSARSSGAGVVNSDFFLWWTRQTSPAFDAVVGNPPFIRYQTFPEPARTRAMDVMRSLGLRPNRLTNIWVPFVAAASASLVEGGRLALVLPAELLQVSYASQLRTFLLERFRNVHIVTCNELLFENAEQEVVMLLAECPVALPSPEGSVADVSMSVASSREELLSVEPVDLIAATEAKHVRHADEKWLKYFLSQQQIDLLRALRESNAVVELGSEASVDVGVVTGKNQFFVVAESEVSEWGLGEYVLPMVGRSAQLPGALLSEVDWKELARAGQRVFLLQLGEVPPDHLPAQVRQYVRDGEAKDYHSGYKCSIRTPWYKVPSVWEPDAFLLRQIYDFPRLVVNDAGATCTDTIHRVRLTGHLSIEELVRRSYTSLTAASAEIEGRSYGGGVLELEPREAERLLVPALDSSSLGLPEADGLIRTGDLEELIAVNDHRVLGQDVGLGKADIELLADAWRVMRDRRLARRRPRRRGPA